MYWCKLPFARLVASVAFIVALASCRPELKETGAQLTYFDLKGYFMADSSRLTAKQPLVTKTVSYNGEAQTKKIKITNWGREFEPFISSDINRPAWRGSYNITQSGDSVVYTATDPELKTRKIVISKAGGKLKGILIDNYTHNLLYESVEKLSYFPDSLYEINKSQHIKLFKQHTYLVKGVF